MILLNGKTFDSDGRSEPFGMKDDINIPRHTVQMNFVVFHQMNDWPLFPVGRVDGVIIIQRPIGPMGGMSIDDSTGYAIQLQGFDAIIWNNGQLSTILENIIDNLGDVVKNSNVHVIGIPRDED